MLCSYYMIVCSFLYIVSSYCFTFLIVRWSIFLPFLIYDILTVYILKGSFFMHTQFFNLLVINIKFICLIIR